MNGSIVADVIFVIVVLVLLYVGFRGQSPGILREFRTKLKGYPDLLVYAALIEDGVMLNKDGALMAGWVYRGNDLDSASSYELESLSERVNAALKRRGSGWMMHADAIRTQARGYASESAFPDRTSALIDQERRAQYEAEGAHYESRYVLIVTYLPPVDQEDKITDLLIEGDKIEENSAERAMRTFTAVLQDIEDNLASHLRLDRLRARPNKEGVMMDDLLGHLTYCVTCEEHPVKLPATPMYLDAMIGGVDFYGGLAPRIGKKNIRCIAITGFPNESYPGMLQGLNRLAMSYRWSNRFIFLDQTEAHKHIESKRKKWFMGRQSMRGYIANQTGQTTGAESENHDALDMSVDAQAALDELSSGYVAYGYYSSVIIIAEEDPGTANLNAREVLKFLFNAGFNVRIEDVNAVEAFMGTHPGNGYANIRKPLVHTRNIADLLPLTAVWCGEAHNPCPFYAPDSPPLLYAATSGATPFRMSLHVGDVGHTLVLGPTGAGKSTLLGLITASQFRYPNSQVFVFDKGYSAYGLVKACGGEHYDIMGEFGSPNFCPLAQIDNVNERAWAAEWLETLIALQGVTLTPGHRKAIYHSLTLLADSESRTMTDLLNGPLQEPTLKAALDRYTLDGPLGMLLDSRTDSLREDIFQVFELEHLMESGANAARNVVPVLLYLFHRIEQRLDGRPTLLILDEAWTFIDNSLFAEKIRDWLKTLRKKNASVIFATQSVSDIMGKPITAALLESCPTKILLPNAEARSQNSSAAYKQMGLSDRQIEILSYAIPKRNYYYMSPLGQRLFDMGLGPTAISFVGASGKEDLAMIRQLERELGGDWPAEWLWRRGLNVAAAYWVGGTEEAADAYAVMEKHRQTWPAEWLQLHGHTREAQRWMAAYQRRTGADEGRIVTELHPASAVR